MSGIFLNPKGNNAFTDILNNRINKVFVDKTDFIGETIDRLDSDAKLIAFTRPRRFGKTVMAQMLASYYSKEADSRSVFSGRKISGYKSIKLIDNQEVDVTYETFINKFDVIYIDMNTVDSRYATYLNREKKHKAADIVDFLENLVISDLMEHDDFASILKKEKIGNIGLADALSAIHRTSGITFILIMDEWDLIYRDYRQDTMLQKKFIDWLKGLFKSSDGLECFSLVYLTGILPIRKYNSQSALNNFKEYNMLSPEPFEKYFGFTEDDISQIVEMPWCKLTRENMKYWYEGYKLNGVDVYNPNSVASAVADGKCKCYWSGSSSNEEFVRLINLNFKGIKTDIIKLLNGMKLPFSSDKFKNDMTSISDKDDVFSLLVCLGYLGCADLQNGKKIAYVPNHEIRQTLLSLVKGQNWSKRIDAVKRSERLFKAIVRKHDGKAVAEIIQEIHNDTSVSLFDYNTEDSLTYCVMSAMQWATLDSYDCHREEQSGKGRVDVVYEPLGMNNIPLIIIEFKYGRSAAAAITQIKKMEYYKRYIQRYKNIILVGINYSKTTKEHECLIECLN
ncbi:MAG: AAA family ATPase [Succinivibrionaceae bacterium]|nr:AAA family ATPase [Succinivibrionaceae bacterium]